MRRRQRATASPRSRDHGSHALNPIFPHDSGFGARPFGGRPCDPLVLPPAGTAGADRPLDPSALAKLAELDPGGASGLLGRVLGTFVRSGTRMRHDLEAGWRAGDLPAVKLVAHTLKSSSAQIGALRLSQACAALEHAIDTRQTAPLAGLVADFGRELDATFRTIAAMTAAGGPTAPTR